MKLKPVNNSVNTALDIWQAQLNELADKPWLVNLLLKKGESLYHRFTHFYTQLQSLPRQTRRILRKKWVVTLASGALILALSRTPRIYAGTITVDGVTCTLADAITSANDGIDTGGCIGSSNSADTIDLQTDITLGSALPYITSVIILEGNNYTIDGNNSVRVLYVKNGDLTLNNTILTGGAASSGGGLRIVNGAAILNNSEVNGNSANWGGGIDVLISTVTLNSSIISGNSAPVGGGLRNNGGTVVLNNSMVTSNTSVQGGGIYNLGYLSGTGEVTLNNSIVSKNSATTGGGIANIGDYEGTAIVTLNNSMVSDNKAQSGIGGGIYNYRSEMAGVAMMTLNNSTVSGNVAGSNGGGIYNSEDNANYYNAATITLNNSTISDNQTTGGTGGGIHNDSGTLTLYRSLISGNTSLLNGDEIFNNSGGVLNVDHDNLLGDDSNTSGSAFYGFSPGVSDITATSDGTDPTALASIISPTLADNGGATQTHALVNGSPAIDASLVGLSTDQRGELRPFGTSFDIGAFEYLSEIDIQVTLNNDNTATITYAVGYELFRSEQPYAGYMPVDTSGSFVWSTVNPSYWQLRSPAGTVVDAFGIFPFEIVPGS